MLLGDSDRDEICELLSRHAAIGRLSLEELEHRVGEVMSAETREEAVSVLADLPPLADDQHTSNRPGSRRRHGQADTPRPDWTPTEERFRDPRSGSIVRVWSDPSGGRHYLPDQ